MRICILCEDSRVEEVIEKTGRKNILQVSCSESGQLPSTHKFCCIATDEKGAQELLSKAEITTMEISGPKEFLKKWNLRIIK